MFIYKGGRISLMNELMQQVSSSAEYIIQHFTAATACRKLEGTVKNMYATGKVTMGMVDELGSAGGAAAVAHKGCFVMWQMVPDKWLIELVVGGHKVVAGSDGNLAWRHTPWLGAHAAKGGVRPLRRTFQVTINHPSAPLLRKTTNFTLNQMNHNNNNNNKGLWKVKSGNQTGGLLPRAPHVRVSSFCPSHPYYY